MTAPNRDGVDVGAVLALLADLPELLLLLANSEPAHDRLHGIAPKIRHARAAVEQMAADLAWLDAFRSDVAETRRVLDPQGQFLTAAEGARKAAETIATLRQRAEAAEADAARLDWLGRAGDVSFGVVVDAPHDGEYSLHHDLPGEHAYGITLRAAIDAAMKEPHDR